MAKNVRINPITGERDYYFPMEITSNEILETAKTNHLEISIAMLGFRKFPAVFVPCKKTSHDATGREIYLDTPSDEQHLIYKELCKDELNAQEDMKQDGRCIIPNGKGSYKRCPMRVPNPNYTPENGQSKTVAIKCQGCKYEPFRQEHIFVNFSCLAHENADGDMENYAPPTPNAYCCADRYLKLREDLIAFLNSKNVKLVPLAELLTLELKKSEAARKLGLPTSTVDSRNKKLQKLLLEFLDNVIC